MIVEAALPLTAMTELPLLVGVDWGLHATADVTACADVVRYAVLGSALLLPFVEETGRERLDVMTLLHQQAPTAVKIYRISIFGSLAGRKHS